VEESQTQEVAMSDAPAEKFQGIDAKGIDSVKLSELKSVLLGDADEKASVKDFPLVAGDEAEGPWVMRVPDELIEAIASIPESRITDTARAWIVTGAFSMDRWLTSDVEEVLRNMQSLFSKPRSPTCVALMWMAL
jgi:hypothetical protein